MPASFDPDTEIERRIEFLADRLRRSGATSYVLGISGGVDSSTAGRLCQLAVERIRAEGGQATFVAMRLPYGVQADEADAQRALEFIRPDETLTVDVKPATDAMVESVRHAGLGERADFHIGNVKARQRMIAQYAGRRRARRSGRRDGPRGRGRDGLLHQVRRRRLRPDAARPG